MTERGLGERVEREVLTTMPTGMKPVDPSPRSSGLSPKIIDEVRELHDRTVSLGRDVSGARGRRARRERREAREAETDLLRVLGFANYDEFAAAVAEPEGDPDAAPEPPGLSLVEPVGAPSPTDAAPGAAVVVPDDEVALDARRTEAALLRVLRSERRGEPAQVAADEHPADEMAALHARIALFEEELAETRFELRRVRDELRGRGDAPVPPSSSPSDAESVGATRDAPAASVLDPHALDALVLAAAELRALGRVAACRAARA